MKIKVAAGLETANLENHLRTFIEQAYNGVINGINTGTEILNGYFFILHGEPPGR
jgi:hypothetical protein